MRWPPAATSTAITCCILRALLEVYKSAPHGMCSTTRTRSTLTSCHSSGPSRRAHTIVAASVAVVALLSDATGACGQEAGGAASEVQTIYQTLAEHGVRPAL